MTGSTIAIIVCVTAIWLAQRLLAIWQSLRFRRQLLELRAHGKLSVGMAKKIGRRVYVGLTVDGHGVVTDNLVLRGVTVFALGKPLQSLNGCRVEDLAAGRIPEGVRPMVAAAATQAAQFLTGRKSTPPARPVRRPAPVAA